MIETLYINENTFLSHNLSFKYLLKLKFIVAYMLLKCCVHFGLAVSLRSKAPIPLIVQFIILPQFIHVPSFQIRNVQGVCIK